MPNIPDVARAYGRIATSVRDSYYGGIGPWAKLFIMTWFRPWGLFNDATTQLQEQEAYWTGIGALDANNNQTLNTKTKNCIIKVIQGGSVVEGDICGN
jgi:hypothetical protein